MGVTALIAKLMAKADAAEGTFDELAVAVVEGKQVGEKAIGEACQAAGKSLRAFADRVEVLTARKAAWDEHYGRDWAGEIEATKRQWKEARKQAEAIQAQRDALLKEWREQNTACERFSRLMNSLPTEQKASHNAMAGKLRQTGSSTDWRAAGAPEPKPQRRRPQPGDHIDLAGGGYKRKAS